MTANECRKAIHVAFDPLGENSLTQTGPYMTQKACVNPNMNLIVYSKSKLYVAEKTKHAKALRIMKIPRTHFALSF